jgi:hypothetical protein
MDDEDDYSVAAKLDKIEGLEDDVVITMSKANATALLANLLRTEDHCGCIGIIGNDYPFHGLIRALKNIL